MGIHWAVCIAHLELSTSPTLLLMCIQGKKNPRNVFKEFIAIGL